jgi:hypothetical protein
VELIERGEARLAATPEQIIEHRVTAAIEADDLTTEDGGVNAIPVGDLRANVGELREPVGALRNRRLRWPSSM